MNKFTPLYAALLGMGILTAPAVAVAAIEFDQNVTPDVIFGSGNGNGSFTTDRNNGVELGLRAKLRFNSAGQPEDTFNSNGDGTYSFQNIIAPTKSAPVAEWAFEWSVNTDFLAPEGTGYSLEDLTYELGLDTDPGLGVNYTVLDHITPSEAVPYWDHAIGNNSTGNGGGTGAAGAPAYMDLLANNNVAQNSWQAHWFFSPFDPEAVGTYAIYLLAKDSRGNVIAKTDIQVLTGGAPKLVMVEPAPIPATSTWSLLAGILGLGLLGGVARRKKLI